MRPNNTVGYNKKNRFAVIYNNIHNRLYGQSVFASTPSSEVLNFAGECFIACMQGQLAHSYYSRVLLNMVTVFNESKRVTCKKLL